MSMTMTPVQLDKARNLQLGFGAMKKFKQKYGKSIMKVDFDKEDPEDFVPVLFYCCLVHEDKELTEEKTIELIDAHLGLKGAIEYIPRILKDSGLTESEEAKNLKAVAQAK